jgi:hypothetical protein
MKTFLALGAVAVLAASCGPEMFHRDREPDAGAQPDAVVGEDAPTDDAGPATDATDAVDGVGPDGSCHTTFPGDVLYPFDSASMIVTGSAADLMGAVPSGRWFPYPEPQGSAALRDSASAWSDVEGHSCSGALAMTASFTVYGPLEKVLGLINFNANWMTPKAYTRMHAWVKVALPSSGNLDHLDAIQLAVNSNNYMSFLGNTVPVSPWVDGDWHEIVLDLVPSTNYLPADIRQIGVQLIAKGVAGVGPSAPVPTTFYVDDIWLELPAP